MARTSNPELERTGVVVESLPNIMFKVALDAGANKDSADGATASEPILAYLSGRMRLHRIRVLVGDRVQLELEPYGGKARIVKRL